MGLLRSIFGRDSRRETVDSSGKIKIVNRSKEGRTEVSVQVQDSRTHQVSETLSELTYEGGRQQLVRYHKPWAHRFVLHGLSFPEGKRMLESLQASMVFGQPSEIQSYQELFEKLFTDYCTRHHPTLSVVESGMHIHELAVRAHKDSKFIDILGKFEMGSPEHREAIQRKLHRAAQYRYLAQFAYVRERESISGAVRHEQRIRAARIRKVGDGWFRAERNAVTRSYRMDQVKWFWPIPHEGNYPLETYFIDVLMNMGSTRAYKIGLFPLGADGLVQPYTDYRLSKG